MPERKTEPTPDEIIHHLSLTNDSFDPLNRPVYQTTRHLQDMMGFK